MDLLFDQQHIWHPYTSLTNPLPTYPVISAKGVYLTLEDGTKLVDGMSSWWSTIHGYNHPQLNQAAKDQIDQMAHVMFGGITHQPAIELCKKLVEVTPDGLDKVFLSDSGSIAVEVAIKMALQYWMSREKPDKNKLLTIKHGYHGDTFAAMAVCDPVLSMHHLYGDLVAKHYFADAPTSSFDGQWDPSDIDSIEQLMVEHHHSMAALILEPIVQGTGGMRIYHPQFLRQCRALCDQYGLLLIADEIATGFGRSGKWFACEHADISPDIICVGKAITGGYLSLAATLCTTEVAQGICNGQAGVLMHGPTFMGNPLACAVAVKNIELLQQNHWQGQVKAIESQLKAQLSACLALESVKDVRVLGAIGAVELHQTVDVAAMQKRLVELGVWIRPFGKMVYIMPPYIIEPEQLQQLTDAIYTVASEM
ncbi:MAG: adenosylmethionine-8-amino-7-oxononanoate aminotransferase [Phenylobacterium sp.]|jgi:adenosylmethionine-8-amino-7-oxononanoate aminotransferase